MALASSTSALLDGDRSPSPSSGRGGGAREGVRAAAHRRWLPPVPGDAVLDGDGSLSFEPDRVRGGGGWERGVGARGTGADPRAPSCQPRGRLARLVSLIFRRRIAIPADDLVGALHEAGSAAFTPFSGRRGATRALTAASASAAASFVAALRAAAAPWADDDGLARPRSALVVVNPASGRRRGSAVAAARVLPALAAAGVAATLLVTSAPGDAAAAAASLDPSLIGAVIAVGGDGTAAEVLGGLVARADPAAARARAVPIALVPAGSGNALAIAAGTGTCDRAAAAAAARGRTAPLDVLCVAVGTTPPTTSHAFLSLTHGLVAAADVGTDGWRWMGPARFVVGALREAFASRAHAVDAWVVPAPGEGAPAAPAIMGAGRVVGSPAPAAAATAAAPERGGAAASLLATLPPSALDPNAPPPTSLPPPWTRLPTDAVGLFAACNLSHLDASTRMAPAAHRGCGRLHVVWTGGRVPLLAALRLLVGVGSGAHVSGDRVAVAEAAALLLRPLDPAAWTALDGEPVPKGAPVAVEVLPGAARLLVGGPPP